MAERGTEHNGESSEVHGSGILIRHWRKESLWALASDWGQLPDGFGGTTEKRRLLWQREPVSAAKANRNLTLGLG